MKPKVQASGEPVARERRDGGQVKLSTFIPLKIGRRGASKVVARPDERNPLPTDWVAQREVVAGLTRDALNCIQTTTA